MGNMVIVFMQLQPAFVCMDDTLGERPAPGAFANVSALDECGPAEGPCARLAYDQALMTRTIVTDVSGRQGR